MKKFFSAFLSLICIALNTTFSNSNAIKIEKIQTLSELNLASPKLRFETDESFNRFVFCFTTPILNSRTLKIKEKNNLMDNFDDILNILYKCSKNKLFLINNNFFHKKLDDTITFNFDISHAINKNTTITLNENQIWWDFVMDLANDYFIPILITENNSKKLHKVAQACLTKIYLYSIKLKANLKNKSPYDKLDAFVYNIEDNFPYLASSLNLFIKK